MNNDEFIIAVAERFDEAEARILDIQKAQEYTQSHLESVINLTKILNASITTQKDIIARIESNERDIKRIINVVENLEKNGIETKKSDSLTSTGEINYDKLVRGLIKASGFIIKNEIQSQIK